MKQVFVSITFIVGFATIGFTAEIVEPQTVSTTAHPHDRTSLFEHYQLCEATAQKRLLSEGEVGICQTVYLHLKLSFVDDMTVEAYNTMSPAERAAINRTGYKRYLAWVNNAS